MMEERQEDEQHDRKRPLPRIRPLLEQEDRDGEHEEPNRLLRHRARQHEEAPEQSDEQARRRPDVFTPNRYAGRTTSEVIRTTTNSTCASGDSPPSIEVAAHRRENAGIFSL